MDRWMVKKLIKSLIFKLRLILEELRENQTFLDIIESQL